MARQGLLAHPSLATLPEWVTEYRPHQVKALGEILEAFKHVDMVVLDAPTGAGKTLIGESTRRMMKADAIYMCNSKALQEQFVRDFPYAKVLKGRSNYPTQREDLFVANDWRSVSCADCDYDKDKGCSWCESRGQCPYDIAKKEAMASPLAVLNTAYFLAATNNANAFSGRELVICDEADTLESELMNYVSIQIPASRLSKLGWHAPKKITVESSWKEWVEQYEPKVGKLLGQVPRDGDVRNIREAKYLGNLAAKLGLLRDGLDNGEWIYTGDRESVSFKPVRVDQVGRDALWRHGGKWLLMSATVISAGQMMEDLGWDGAYETVNVDCTFPVENRKVVVRPSADLSRKANEDGSQSRLLLSCIKRIVADHPGESVLIHTVSYALAKTVADGLQDVGRPIVSYTNSADKELALASFKAQRGSVLVASSMDRGVDLPDDACRVQIIAKVPFPFLGDKQISARLYAKGGKTWYAVQTIRSIVQSTGRAVRHREDYAVTYILDRQFETNVWANNRRLFPEYWRESLVWETSTK